jgi:hypothetical protein
MDHSKNEKRIDLFMEELQTVRSPVTHSVNGKTPPGEKKGK